MESSRFFHKWPTLVARLPLAVNTKSKGPHMGGP